MLFGHGVFGVIHASDTGLLTLQKQRITLGSFAKSIPLHRTVRAVARSTRLLQRPGTSIVLYWKGSSAVKN